MDDQELNRLLREWTAPGAPPGLRPRGPRMPWLQWLVSGTIRVPVPVALAAMLVAGVWLASTQAMPAPTPAPSPGSASPPAASGARPSGELARYALTGALEGFDAVLVELTFAPGVSAPEHRHPGPILGYVVDGPMRFSVDHQPEQLVPAGGTFFEPPGALHTVFGSGSADAPVRIVAFLVVPNGSPLVER